MAKQITPETTTNLYILGYCVASLFFLYQIFAPYLEMVKVNASTIDSHYEMIKSLKENQHEIISSQKENHKETNQHILKVSNAVSRILGKMEK